MTAMTFEVWDNVNQNKYIYLIIIMIGKSTRDWLIRILKEPPSKIEEKNYLLTGKINTAL